MDEELICPISLEILEDPITMQDCCGKTFSRANIIQAFNANGKKCPICSHSYPNLNPETLPKNVVIANLVELFKKKEVANDNSEDVDPWAATCSVLNKELDQPQTQTVIAKLNIVCQQKEAIKECKTLLLLVVDRSGSMNGKPINQAKLALSGIMNKTKKNDSIVPYILAYDHTIMKFDDPNQIQARGGTDFVVAFDGIVSACRQYEDKVQNVIMIFLTDGQCGGPDLQKVWMNNFKENLSKVCTHPRIIHTIGFGGYHDFNFLDSIRKLGTVEGSYRFADPAENDDSLFSKINSVTDTIVGSSIVPIKVTVDGKLYEVDLINQRASCWIHSKPKFVSIDMKEYSYEIEVDLEEVCDPNLWVRWYSHLTDNIINETLQFEQERGTLAPSDIELYGELLLRRCKAIMKALSKPSYELDDGERTDDPAPVMGRLTYVIETIRNLMTGAQIDKLKLTDIKYEGQFVTKAGGGKPEAQAGFNSLVANVPKVEVYVKPKLVPFVYKERFKPHLPCSQKFPYVSCSKNDAVDADCGNDVDSENTTVLSFASSIGRCVLVKKFLAYDVSQLNTANTFGEMPLDRAVIHGHWNTVGILLDKGAKFNLSSQMLLHTCLVKGYYNTAQKMVSYDMLVVTKDDLQYFSSSTVAQWIMNNIKIDDRTRDLTTIQKGIADNLPKFSMESYEFRTYPKIFTEPNEGHLEVVSYLLQKGISSAKEEWCQDDDIVWALFLACEKGNLQMVEVLLEYCKDIIDKQTKKGTTCLWIASCNRHIDIVLVLLGAGADPNICNEKGDPPMVSACQKGADMIVRLLLDADANLTLSNKNRDNTILICCRNGQSKILEMLLEECVKKKILEEQMQFYAEIDGFNPLLAATELDKISCIEVLHKFGADLEHRTEHDNKILPGATAIHLACFYGNMKSVEVLHKLGADLNTSTTVSGKTPLHLAIEHKHLSITRYLISHDVKHVYDNDGYRPEYYAKVKGNEDIYNEFFNEPLSNLLVRLANTDCDKVVACKIIQHHAQSLGCFEYIDILEMDCGKGMNLLSVAILRNDQSLITMLENMGANYNAVDNRGLTPQFWKDFVSNKGENQLVSKVQTVIKADLQNKVLLDMSKKAITYEPYEKNNGIIPKMNFGFGSTVLTQTLIELQTSVTKSYSLLGFVNHINKYISCNKNEMALLLWDAKVHTIAKIATNEIEGLKPVNLLALYLFTIDNDICLQLNQKLANFKKTDTWTPYMLCLYQSLTLLPPFLGEVYRKINQLFYQPLGTIIEWNSFGVGTSSWGSIQLDKTSTVFIVKSKTGRDISPYSKDSQNNEIVFMPGSKFEVTNYYINDVIVFGQENIRNITFKAKDADIQKVVEGKSSLIVELQELV